MVGRPTFQARLTRAVHRCVSRSRDACVTVDTWRVLFFGITGALLALAGRQLGNSSIPLLHLELLILAPFLRQRFGLALMLVSLATDAARVAQGLFGFDQLFVSVPLLLHNLKAFPFSYALRLAMLLAAALGVVAVLLKLLPKRPWRAGLLPLAAAVTLTISARAAEDSIKQNLVGTSFGYLAGQASFSGMFNKGYTVPGGPVINHPAVVAAREAIDAQQNLWLIVVESMGMPKDPVLQRLLLGPLLADADLHARYDIVSGQLSSVGSTIHGELRALCGGQLTQGLFDDLNNDDCLPARLAAVGYATQAVHANIASMYGRDVWYRKIGFKKYSASDTEPGLIGPTRTGMRWGTLLDGDAIAWVDATAFPPGLRKFTYLLTVSTHLPAEALPGAAADADCLAKATEHACLHLGNLRLVMTQLAEAARARDDTVIVLIGDHPPPFVSPGSRSAFSPSDVPWIKLRPRQPSYR